MHNDDGIPMRDPNLMPGFFFPSLMSIKWISPLSSTLNKLLAKSLKVGSIYEIKELLF